MKYTISTKAAKAIARLPSDEGSGLKLELSGMEGTGDEVFPRMREVD